MRSISRRAARLALPIPERPRLRGVLHQYAFFVSLFCGVGLILAASAGRARLAAAIYAAAVSALLALKGTLASVILIALWIGAIGGVVFKLVWIDAPKWLFAAVYVALGLVTAAVFGELPAAIGWLGVAGLATGGLLYVIGAVIYASGRPNPVPSVFGYHEVFHTFVLAAAGLHYAVIAFAVLPRG